MRITIADMIRCAEHQVELRSAEIDLAEMELAELRAIVALLKGLFVISGGIDVSDKQHAAGTAYKVKELFPRRTKDSVK